MFPMLHPTERQPMASRRGGRSLAALWALMATRTASLRPAPATQRLIVQVGQGQPRGVSIPPVRLLELVTLQARAWGLLPILCLCKSHESSGAMAPGVHSREAALPICTVVSLTTDQGPCDLGSSRFTKAKLTDVPPSLLLQLVPRRTAYD